MVLLQESIFPPDEDETTGQLPPLSDVDSVPPKNQLDLRIFSLHSKIIDLMEETRTLTRTWTGDLQSCLSSLLQRLLHIELCPKDHRSSLSDACRYALCLFLLLLFSGHYPDPTLLINCWLQKLKSALVRVVPMSGVKNKLIVWLLAIGGVAALNTPERDWFVGYLLAAVTSLELESWEDMEEAMSRVLWVHQIHDPEFQKLWKEVQSLKESLLEQDPLSVMLFPETSSIDGNTLGRVEDIE